MRPQAPPVTSTLEVDTTGDGFRNAVAVDTTGDGRADSVAPDAFEVARASMGGLEESERRSSL